MKDISTVLMDNRINLKHYGEGNQKVKTQESEEIYDLPDLQSINE